MPHPQSVSSITPETHGREEKHREKKKNTKTGEILVSEEDETTHSPDGKVELTYQMTYKCTKRCQVIAPPHYLEISSHTRRIL